MSSNLGIASARTARDGRQLGLRARHAFTATTIAFLGTWWLGVFHHVSGEHAHTSLPSALDVLRGGSLVWPAVAAVVALAMWMCDRSPAADRSRETVGLAVAAVGAALVLGSVVPLESLLVGVQTHTDLSLRLHYVRDAVVALAVCLPVALATWKLTGVRVWLVTDEPATPTVAWSPARWRRALVVAGSAVSVILAGGGQLILTSPATAAPTGVCATASRTISYDVVAMDLDLPLNGWGDHIPDGKIFALSNADASPNAADIKAEPGRATPLLLRAAVGDCIKVHFKNEIKGKRVGMHVDGVAKAVTGPEASDGARIGYNDDSTAAPGTERTYTWFAQREGQFPINDYGSGTDFQLTDTSDDTTSHGLYGGLVVLPAGFTWHDPTTGKNLLAPDGHGLGAPVIADARGPGKADDFRDAAMVLTDEPEDVCAPEPRPGGSQTTDPGTTDPGTTDPGTTDPAGAEAADPAGAEAVDPAGADAADPAGGEAACVTPTFPTTGIIDSPFRFHYRTPP